MPCAVCGVDLAPGKQPRLYCSRSCQNKAYERRRREQEKRLSRCLAILQRVRSAAGLPPVLEEPYLNYQAELQAAKTLLLQLEADQAKRSAPVRRQVKQTTSADALREGPDPHAQYVGIGKAVAGRKTVLVVRFGRDPKTEP